VVVIPRLEVEEIPEWLKPDNGLWPWLSRVEFVKRSVKGYLAGYVSKPIWNVPKGWRNYEVHCNISGLSYIYNHKCSIQKSRKIKENQKQKQNQNQKL